MDREHKDYNKYIGEVIACEVLCDCDKQHYSMPLHFEYEGGDKLHKCHGGDKQAIDIINIDIIDSHKQCGCEVVRALDEQHEQLRAQIIRTLHHDVKQCKKCPSFAYCKQITDRYCYEGSNWRYSCKRSKSKGSVRLVLYLKSQTGRVEMSHSYEWRVSEKGVVELSCDRLMFIKRAVECKVKKVGKYQSIIGGPVDLFVELNIDMIPCETAEEAVHKLTECYRGIDGIEGFRYIYTPIQIYEPARVQVYRYGTKDGKCELLADMHCHEYDEYSKRAEQRIAKW